MALVLQAQLSPAPNFSAIGIRVNADNKPGIVGDDPEPLTPTDAIACIYTPKLFNSWPHFGDGKGHRGATAINGGIPQRHSHDDRKPTRGMYWVMILTAPTLPLCA
jgi:hypothetical protein